MRKFNIFYGLLIFFSAFVLSVTITPKPQIEQGILQTRINEPFRNVAYPEETEVETSECSNDDYSCLIAQYTEEIRLNPVNSEAYFNRGWAYGDIGDDKNAIKDYTKAIEFDPNDSASYGNGIISKNYLKRKSKEADQPK